VNGDTQCPSKGENECGDHNSHADAFKHVYDPTRAISLYIMQRKVSEQLRCTAFCMAMLLPLLRWLEV